MEGAWGVAPAAKRGSFRVFRMGQKLMQGKPRRTTGAAYVAGIRREVAPSFLDLNLGRYGRLHLRGNWGPDIDILCIRLNGDNQ